MEDNLIVKARVSGIDVRAIGAMLHGYAHGLDDAA